MADPKFRNTFKYEPVDFTRKNLWMHSVERTDTCGEGNIICSFAILICLMALVALLTYVAAEYPKAYPDAKQPTLTH